MRTLVALGLLAVVTGGCVAHPLYGCVPAKTKTQRDFLLCGPLEPDDDERDPHGR